MPYIFTYRTHWFAFLYKIGYWLYAYLATWSICFLHKETLFVVLAADLLKEEKNLIFTNLTEAFWAYLYLSTLFAACLVLPVTSYFIYLYSVKGCYNYVNLLRINKLVVIININLAINIILFKKLWPALLLFFFQFKSKNTHFNLILTPSFIEYLVLFFKIVINSISLIVLVTVITHLTTKLSKKHIRFKSYLLFFALYAVFAPPELLVQIITVLLITLTYEITNYLFTVFYQLKKAIDGGGIRTHDET